MNYNFFNNEDHMHVICKYLNFKDIKNLIIATNKNVIISNVDLILKNKNEYIFFLKNQYLFKSCKSLEFYIYNDTIEYIDKINFVLYNNIIFKYFCHFLPV